MRFALVTSPIVLTALLFACTTFSSGDDTPPPPSNEDAGPETGAGECTPVVADPNAPQDCGDLTIATNCGTCGHSCVDALCLEGRCVAQRLTDTKSPPFALEGRALYVAAGSEIKRADLGAKPITFDTFYPSVFGTMTRLEVYEGELYVSTSDQPTIINLATKEQRGNEYFSDVKTPRGDGLFYPGRIAYYLHPLDGGGYQLARIDTASRDVRTKAATDFLPVSRSGDELFWTEKLQSGAQIWGAWDDPKPLVGSGEPIAGFVADGKDLYLVSGGFVRRLRNGALVDIAKEEKGVGLSFAVSGNDLFYLVKRSVPGEDRYQVYRVDKCKGGRPVLVYESINTAATQIAVDGTEHVLVSTDLGLFRVRR